MNSKYILIFSLLLLQACTIIDDIFPPDKVQVVDPVRRKPLLNTSLPTDIGMNAINNTHAYAPSWPKSQSNVPSIPPAPIQTSLPVVPQSAPVIPIAANSQPTILPSAPAFQSPYSAVAIAPSAPITPVPVTPVVSTPVAPPKVVAPKVPATIPSEFMQPKTGLQYPDLAQVRQPQVAPASSELDQRVQELKRDLEISKNARANVNVPQAPVVPQIPPVPVIPEAPVLKPIADQPIVTRPVESFPTPVAVAPVPAVEPAFVKPVAAPILVPQPAVPARQAATLPSQLRLPSGSGRYRSSANNGVAREDYIDGYVHSPKNKYRHSNLRRGN